VEVSAAESESAAVGLDEGTNIVLVGFMGTGKSAVGRRVARKLERRFFDTDSWIVRQAGRSIPEIFAQDGEERFRELETEAARAVSVRRGLVVATGGGILARPENVRLLKRRGILICLTARPEVIVQRTAPWRSRPLLRDAADPRALVEQLMTQRAALYAQADWTIDSSDVVSDVVAQTICEKLQST
jgi:shikimate kinase